MKFVTLLLFACRVPYAPIHPTILHVQSLETKRKEKKRKINIDLAVLPSHDTEQETKMGHRR